MAIYHFLIDRRTLWGLIAAGTLVGTLLFFAGLLVGLHQNLPAEPVQARNDGVQTAAVPALATPTTVQPAPSTSAPSVSGPAVTGPSATSPSAPAVRVQASTTSAPSASLSGGPRATRPTLTRPTLTRPSVTRPTVTGTPRSASTTLAAPPPSPGATTAQPAGDGAGPVASQGVVAEAAGTEPSAPGQETAPPPPLPPPLPTAFSIQVGAYRETRYLEAALEDLRSRGYSPYVVPITGSGGLVFRTIRIGQYGTRKEAVRAAAEFHHRESMTALVRTVTPEMRLSHSPTDPSATAPPAAEPPPSVGL